jgi:hypothetical protein
MVSLVFGAAVYEALVVHPAWSRKPPESFQVEMTRIRFPGGDAITSSALPRTALTSTTPAR